MAGLVLNRVELLSIVQNQLVAHTFSAVETGSMPVVAVGMVPRGGFKRTPRGS